MSVPGEFSIRHTEDETENRLPSKRNGKNDE
jgi:hypothetical protein